MPHMTFPLGQDWCWLKDSSLVVILWILIDTLVTACLHTRPLFTLGRFDMQFEMSNCIQNQSLLPTMVPSESVQRQLCGTAPIPKSSSCSIFGNFGGDFHRHLCMNLYRCLSNHPWTSTEMWVWTCMISNPSSVWMSAYCLFAARPSLCVLFDCAWKQPVLIF